MGVWGVGVGGSDQLACLPIVSQDMVIAGYFMLARQLFRRPKGVNVSVEGEKIRSWEFRNNFQWKGASDTLMAVRWYDTLEKWRDDTLMGVWLYAAPSSSFCIDLRQPKKEFDLVQKCHHCLSCVAKCDSCIQCRPPTNPIKSKTKTTTK